MQSLLGQRTNNHLSFSRMHLNLLLLRPRIVRRKAVRRQTDCRPDSSPTRQFVDRKFRRQDGSPTGQKLKHKTGFMHGDFLRVGAWKTIYQKKTGKFMTDYPLYTRLTPIFSWHKRFKRVTIIKKTCLCSIKCKESKCKRFGFFTITKLYDHLNVIKL